MAKKSFLISGAGAGIGRATAIKLNKMGHELILLGRNADKLEETKKMLGEGNHQVISCDVRDAKGLASQLADINPTNLAGIIANQGLSSDNHYGEGDMWHDLIEVNLTGSYILVNEALKYLKQSSGYRHIVLVSSVVAHIGVPNYTAYSAAKAGLLGMTRSWAAELASDKILVNSVSPGWVDTEMARGRLNILAEESNQSFDTTYEQAMSYVPLQKWSEADEVAATIAFLVSDEQRSITGEEIQINNGAYMA